MRDKLAPVLALIVLLGGGGVSLALAAQLTQTAESASPASLEAANQPASKASEQAQPIRRYDFKLPKMFDFERYKRLYKRKYSSELEESSRRRIFYARAFATFLSYFGYKYNLTSSYLSINPWSDRTRSERRRVFVEGSRLTRSLSVSGGSGGNGGNGTDNAAPSKWLEEEAVAAAKGPLSLESETMTACVVGDGKCDPILAMDFEDVKREFSYVVAHKHEPGFKEMADALLRDSRRRKRRSVEQSDASADDADGSIEREQLSLDDLIEQPAPSDFVGEQQGGVAAGGVADQTRLKAASKEPARAPSPNDDYIGQVDNYVDERREAASAEREAAEIETEPDLVYKDHRESKCFDSPRAQSDCGSCYAFASVALYEWLYCYYTKSKVKFSEQYVIDCGQRNQLGGCDGGSPADVSLFVQQHGLELLRNYPYRGKQDTCPYDHYNTQAASMGYLRLEEPGFKRVIGVKRIELYLERTPVIIGLATPANFHDYGGGVDPAKGCDKSDGHAMLLIGRGREDGQEYWLFRNSFGVGWGEGGHYKMDVRALPTCLLGQQGYISSAYIEGHDSIRRIKNPNYESRAIRHRTADYLKHRLAEWQPTAVGR